MLPRGQHFMQLRDLPGLRNKHRPHETPTKEEPGDDRREIHVRQCEDKGHDDDVAQQEFARQLAVPRQEGERQKHGDIPRQLVQGLRNGLDQPDLTQAGV